MGIETIKEILSSNITGYTRAKYINATIAMWGDNNDDGDNDNDDSSKYPTDDDRYSASYQFLNMHSHYCIVVTITIGTITNNN